jgi:hypothetical protein
VTTSSTPSSRSKARPGAESKTSTGSNHE